MWGVKLPNAIITNFCLYKTLDLFVVLREWKTMFQINSENTYHCEKTLRTTLWSFGEAGPKSTLDPHPVKVTPLLS